jgi:hypothetical protein
MLPEGMFDDLENLGPLLQALGHAIEHGLVFEAGNGACVVRASRAHRAVTTGSSITVIDFGEIAQPAVADWRQHLPGWANIDVAPRECYSQRHLSCVPPGRGYRDR